MPAIIAIFAAFVVGLVLRLRGMKLFVAWLLAFCVVPAFVLIAEFVLPYMGGGASMWPIALVVGGIFGAISGGLGVIIASFFVKDKKGILKWLAKWFRNHSVLGDDERLR